MANPERRRASPANEMRTVGAGRKPGAKLRTRQYLTEAEIERLIKAASGNRYGHRDTTLLLVVFRHGCGRRRTCSLRWSDIDLERGNAHVRRIKNGDPSAHPLAGRELRALRRLKWLTGSCVSTACL